MNFSLLLQTAINKAGKQETLSAILSSSASALSKRINGEVGWQEPELNKLLEYVQMNIVDVKEYERKISSLKETLRIILNEDIKENR